MQLDAYALTVPGRRDNNEDAICVRPDLGLFVVADGMGGYEGGEVASALAVEAICELVRRTSSDADVTWPYTIDPARAIDENEIIVATRLANERISAQRTGVLEQMGSTVAVLRIADDRAVIGHVGDSRVYRLRDGVLAQLTIDHSLLAQLIASGTPPADIEHFPWRHVVTRALGTPTGEPEVSASRALPGDVYLLCSDGLSEPLPEARIAELMQLPAERACKALVDAAFAAGSRDNISAIVVRVLC
jgi:serine/threonine protein phosphatase PrpC